MNIAFYTLGCKVNQYETQAMEQIALGLGYQLVAMEEQADAYVINTCTVTAVSDKKCRGVIRRLRRRAPDAVIGVCGCYAQVSPDAVRALGVDVIAGTGGREAFFQQVLQTLEDRQHRELLDDALRRREPFEQLPAGSLEERTRAMLKVQDGCQNFCSYCMIPYARGPVRSLPLAAAVEQAKGLQRRGYRELVLTGIEISSWGKDLGETLLPELVAAICEAVPTMRIRLGSLEPRTINEAFCETLGSLSNLCPQFHLSLQSGSDRTLSRMNRKYHTERFAQSVELLRQTFPGCAVTTDLIVGFPGETESEFEETLAFLQRIRFAQMHIFPYSRRPGTKAAQMPEQIPAEVKQRRAERAALLAGELAREYRAQMIGTTADVLFEQPEHGYFVGHAANYVKFYVRAEQLHNQLRKVRAMGLFEDGLLGELE